MRVTTNKAQYHAVNQLHGLPPAAHTLIMCSRFTDTGGVPDRDEDAFDELVSFIGSELAEGMVSGRAARALRSAAVKIDSDCADSLGM